MHRNFCGFEEGVSLQDAPKAIFVCDDAPGMHICTWFPFVHEVGIGVRACVRACTIARTIVHAFVHVCVCVFPPLRHK